MARKKRWTTTPYDKGVEKYILLSWRYFLDFINQELLNYNTYIYRGHGDSNWKLEPTIDRYVKDPTSPKRQQLLENFKFATRGRRGNNPPQLQTENDWWALGQHHGLKTPLLDWSESPFVALFFAVDKAIQLKSKTCSVWILSQYSVQENNSIIRSTKNIEKINNQLPTVKLFRPLTNENNRLVNQRGLFTRGPNNIDMKTWIQKFHTNGSRGSELLEIVIPNKDLLDCMTYLNKMNINHSTLFPDLSGAANYCNMALDIEHYT